MSFGVVMEPGSVPHHAFLVEPDGLPCVDWEWEPGHPPSKGDLLSEFAGLADLEAESVGPAIGQLIERFGVLSLCEPHGRPLDMVEHAECDRLRPEPIALWLEHARRVHRVLHILRALDKGEDPDPYLVRGSTAPRDNLAKDFTDRWSLKIEQRKREKEWTPDQAEEEKQFNEQFPQTRADLDEYVDASAAALQTKQDELSESVANIQRLLPGADDTAEWRGRIISLVNDGLFAFPTTLHLDQDEVTGAMRPVLSTKIGLLSRVYLSLAMEAAQAPGVAFCTGCASPYAPKRRPKRGQDNFCPQCREAGVAQRLHMRRKRAANVSVDPTT